MRIILASSNKDKIKEIKDVLNRDDILSLEDIGYQEEIEEFGKTLHQNALIKAETIAEKFPNDIVISDDSGLFVNALNGSPGVYSARYAQDEEGYAENKYYTNNAKLLRVLKNEFNRNATFKTVICLIQPGNEPIFLSGHLEGKIAYDINEGPAFGYNAVFQYKDEYLNTLSKEELYKISHRKQAVEKLKEYLE